jgi:hypothetical protein
LTLLGSIVGRSERCGGSRGLNTQLSGRALANTSLRVDSGAGG